MFSIRFEKPAERFIEKLKNKIFQRRILYKIEKLKEKPLPKGVKTVFGYKDKVFRVRVGDYRILYVVDFMLKIIIISKVDKRSRIYE